jgi:hypothetical protein
MTQIFINIFIIYYRKRGDRGKDIDGKITSIPFVIQCKNYLVHFYFLWEFKKK